MLDSLADNVDQDQVAQKVLSDLALTLRYGDIFLQKYV